MPCAESVASISPMAPWYQANKSPTSTVDVTAAAAVAGTRADGQSRPVVRSAR